jgi:hypothetical protein
LSPIQQHLPQQEIQKTGLSAQAPNSSNNEIIEVDTVVQQITTEFSESVSEKDKIMVITKMVLKFMKKMTARFHSLPKVIAIQMEFEGSNMRSVNSCKP